MANVAGVWRNSFIEWEASGGDPCAWESLGRLCRPYTVPRSSKSEGKVGFKSSNWSEQSEQSYPGTRSLYIGRKPLRCI